MHCHRGTNNRVPRWTFTDPCKPEARPGAREESASPVWLAAPAMNARDTKKVYIWRLDTGCGPIQYRKCHSHNTPGKRHNNTWVEPLAGNCTTISTRQREQVLRLYIHHWIVKDLYLMEVVRLRTSCPTGTCMISQISAKFWALMTSNASSRRQVWTSCSDVTCDIRSERLAASSLLAITKDLACIPVDLRIKTFNFSSEKMFIKTAKITEVLNNMLRRLQKHWPISPGDYQSIDQ